MRSAPVSSEPHAGAVAAVNAPAVCQSVDQPEPPATCGGAARIWPCCNWVNPRRRNARRALRAAVPGAFRRRARGAAPAIDSSHGARVAWKAAAFAQVADGTRRAAWAPLSLSASQLSPMRAATTHRSSARPVSANCWTSVVTAPTTSEGDSPLSPWTTWASRAWPNCSPLWRASVTPSV